MNRCRNAVLFSFAISASLSSAAAAQGKCEPNTSSPFQVNSARIYMIKAREGKFKDEQKKQARDAIRVLTEKSDKIGNQLGRNYLLAQAYLWWLEQPDVSTTVRRGDIGFTENAGGTIDLYAALDTAIKAVETGNPACRTDPRFIAYRRAPWSKQINAALPLINSGALDSAKVLVRNANTLMPDAPLGAYYTAIIAQKQNENDAAIEAYKRVVALSTPEAMAADSTVKKLRSVSLYNYAALLQNRADQLSGEEKNAALRASAEPLQTYVREFPDAENIAAAQAALARALGQAGDTAAVAQIYAEMLSDPKKFTDIQLFEAGTNAFRAGRRDEAARLFESGLALNPYYRDGLFNLANTYLATQQYDKMLPVTRTLVSVDPNNPDNWRLLAGAYQGLQKQTKDSKLQRAYVDSVLKFLEKEKGVAVKLAFKQFRHDGAKHKLTGSVENASATPGEYVIKFEFLDKSGNVVASETATVSVPARSKKEFTVEVEKEGIVSFRYAPIG
ncbi:MAG: tetratricopeptide repeat protein [Gemmatimonadaceae bacterium]